MGNHKRKLKIIMCTDPMSCMMYDNDQGKEYDAIEKDMQENLPDFKISFVRDVFPHDLANESFEVYLFDFGGMLPGCEDMIASHYRELIRQVEDHQSSAFILYSSFSVRWYKELMEIEAKELTDQLNVFCHDYDDEWIGKLQEWLSVN